MLAQTGVQPRQHRQRRRCLRAGVGRLWAYVGLDGLGLVGLVGLGVGPPLRAQASTASSRKLNAVKSRWLWIILHTPRRSGALFAQAGAQHFSNANGTQAEQHMRELRDPHQRLRQDVFLVQTPNREN